MVRDRGTAKPLMFKFERLTNFQTSFRFELAMLAAFEHWRDLNSQSLKLSGFLKVCV